MEDSFTQRIKDLNEIITNSKKIVFFGGAGVSTASGIPDFRSANGLYHMDASKYYGREPEYLLSKDCLKNHPAMFFNFYREFLDARKYEPNMAHIKLAELEKAGKLIGIVTQNIDGLHQKAGSQKVFEIHGTTERNYCQVCGNEFPSDYIFDYKDTIPKCPECGGIVRPDVTLYGEQLPYDEVDKAIKAISEADTLIIGGTSLTVQPAASYLIYFHGKNLIVINRSATQYDETARLVFNEDIAEVFSKIEI